jgi:arginyl-tRNA synthetase
MNDEGPSSPAASSPERARVNFRAALADRFSEALVTLAADQTLPMAAPPDLSGQVRETAEPTFGDYTGTMAMPLARPVGRKPRDIATSIGERLPTTSGYTRLFEPPGPPAGPGFINVRVREAALAEVVTAAVRDDRLGVAPVERPDTIVIDCSSPNVAKPMHVGHIRSTVIGDALARILRFRGHRVITDNHLGDWGTQFGMILWGWKHCRDQAAFAADATGELGRLYRLVRKVVDADAKELAGDPEARRLAERYPDVAREVLAETAALHEGDAENRRLWEQFMPLCRREIDRIYDRLQVSFDHVLGESFYQPMLGGVVDELLALGIARESRGAVGVFLAGDDEPPLLIRKADGAFLYATTDLATIRWRLENWRPDRILYVVDHRQSRHFSDVFATARRWLGEPCERVRLEHVAFGTVLGDDGRPFRTRAGDTVGLERLLDEGVERAARLVAGAAGGRGVPEADRPRVAEAVGIGAIKYADLAQNRTTDSVFSFDKMLQLTGNTAAYMQYAVARVEGIFARGGIDRVSLRHGLQAVRLGDPKERSLALALVRFSEALEDVETDLRPNVLTAYLYDLAGRYSVLYDALPVLKADAAERQSRLALCDLTGRVLRTGLELLGITAVEQM